jgi:hypothetical protein
MYNNLAVGLYPALLSGGGGGEVEKVFRFAMMLGVPLFFGAVFLGEDILRLLRPAYVEAALALYVLTISYWVSGLTSLLATIVSGIEDVDRQSNVSFKDYSKSWLFHYNFMVFLLNAVYVSVFSAVAVVARTGGWGAADTAYAWAYVHLGSSVAGVMVGYFFSRRRVVFRVPWASLLRYAAASTVMVAAMYPLYVVLPVSNTAVVQFVRVGAMLVVGIATYLGAVVLLDREGRGMVKLLITRLTS